MTVLMHCNSLERWLTGYIWEFLFFKLTRNKFIINSWASTAANVVFVIVSLLRLIFFGHYIFWPKYLGHLHTYMMTWQSIWSKLASWTYLRWISKLFFFGALPSDTLKIKHTKKLKEIPSRHVLENLPEKACMNAFIHLKLISNVQGFN